MIVTHGSATPFDTVDPQWRTYCGLTAEELVGLINASSSHSGAHSWAPGGRMTCKGCRSRLPPTDNREMLEAWLTS